MEGEKRRVELEVMRKEEGYLQKQVREMKGKTNAMSLAVNIKEYLN